MIDNNINYRLIEKSLILAYIREKKYQKML